MSIHIFDEGFRANWDLKSEDIVMTNGVFDILHRGHVTYLNEAKKLNKYLVVGVNSDSSVKALGKGAERPYINEADRAFIISQLKPVDAVIIFNESTPIKLISEIKPSVFVKGSDYTLSTLPESEVVLSQGGRVEFISLSHGYSTTSIVSSIKN